MGSEMCIRDSTKTVPKYESEILVLLALFAQLEKSMLALRGAARQCMRIRRHHVRRIRPLTKLSDKMMQIDGRHSIRARNRIDRDLCVSHSARETKATL